MTKCEEAAHRFLRRLLPGVDLRYPQGQPYAIVSLVVAAYRLYEIEWDCHDHHIENWQWPIKTLADGEPFDGDQPWSVLLRRAIELAAGYEVRLVRKG